MKTSYKGFSVGDAVVLVEPAFAVIDNRRDRLPVGVQGTVVRIQAWLSKPANTKHRHYLVLEVPFFDEVVTLGVNVEQVKKLSKIAKAA